MKIFAYTIGWALVAVAAFNILLMAKSGEHGGWRIDHQWQAVVPLAAAAVWFLLATVLSRRS